VFLGVYSLLKQDLFILDSCLQKVTRAFIYQTFQLILS